MPAVCRPYDDDPDAGPIRPDEAVLYVVCVQRTVTVPFVHLSQPTCSRLVWYSTKFPLVRMQWAKGDIQIQYGGGAKPKCLCGLVCLPSQQGTEFPLNNKKKKQGTELMMTSLTFSPTWAYIARRLTTVSVAEGILLEGIATKNMHGMESCQRNKKICE